MKRERFNDVLELALLFGILFLPSYLAQSTRFDQSILYTISYNAQYIIAALPQTLFLLLLVTRAGRGAEHGLVRVATSDSIWLVFTVGVLYVTALPVSLLRLGLEATNPIAGIKPAVEGVVPGIPGLVLIGVSSLLTGYREELFYRSALYMALKRIGIEPIGASAISGVIFASGHLYQGLVAFAGTFVMALLLTWIFERRRNIHVIAIGHAIYNFIILIVSVLNS